jgi:hypothetical protein
MKPKMAMQTVKLRTLRRGLIRGMLFSVIEVVVSDSCILFTAQRTPSEATLTAKRSEEKELRRNAEMNCSRKRVGVKGFAVKRLPEDKVV